MKSVVMLLNAGHMVRLFAFNSDQQNSNFPLASSGATIGGSKIYMELCQQRCS
jgi:hypothetical protein